MCTLVRTRDVTVLLDAGVALGPRFRLMPHPREFRARDEARERINEAAAKAKVITISHYHNDHHTPNYLDPVWLGSTPELSEKTYSGKIVLAKDFRSNINTAQRRRGWMFKQSAAKWAEEAETLVIPHHLLRAEGWYMFLDPVRKPAEKVGHKVITAAKPPRKEPNPLECRRKELNKEEKPSAEFLKGAKLPKEKWSETVPP